MIAILWIKLWTIFLFFEGQGEIKDILGNYSIWREEQKQLQYNKTNKKPSTDVLPEIKTQETEAPSVKEKNKLTYKEKIELEQLELDLELLEKEKTKLENELGGANQEPQFIMETSNKTKRSFGLVRNQI